MRRSYKRKKIYINEKKKRGTRNTIGASVHPDFLIYTEKEITPDGAIKYHLYSGYPTSEELTDLEGNKLKRRSIMLNCLEAGEEAYLERSKTYEISLH